MLKYAQRLVDELPPQEFTIQEEKAGFPQLFETFGFYATMDSVARYVGKDDEEVLKWSVNKFYTKLKWMAWQSYTQKEYQKIMNKN